MAYKSILPYGLKKENGTERLVYISDISLEERGLKCGCICPKCGMQLQAKLPNTDPNYTPRFAHQNGDICEHALETTIHIKAKEIIEKAGFLYLPEVVAKYKDMEKKIFDKQKAFFDQVKLEYRINNIIPDVVAYKNEKVLIIEIKITHGVDKEKLEKIKSLGISALEIDLSKESRDFRPKKLYESIIKRTDIKKWIYNLKVEEALESMKEEYKEKLKAIKVDNKENGSNKNPFNSKKYRNILLDFKYQKELRKIWENDFTKNPVWIRSSKVLNISEYSVPKYLNIEIKGDFVLGCDRRVWQTYVFQKFIFKRQLDLTAKIKIFRVSDIIKSIKIDFNAWIINEILDIKKRNNSKHIPGLTDVIYSYLIKLEKKGFIQEIPSGIIYNTKFKIID